MFKKDDIVAFLILASIILIGLPWVILLLGSLINFLFVYYSYTITILFFMLLYKYINVTNNNLLSKKYNNFDKFIQNTISILFGMILVLLSFSLSYNFSVQYDINSFISIIIHSPYIFFAIVYYYFKIMDTGLNS